MFQTRLINPCITGWLVSWEGRKPSGIKKDVTESDSEVNTNVQVHDDNDDGAWHETVNTTAHDN